MPQYIAFLRGINLGKRRLGMSVLRDLFAQMKFTDVATFIASGNVLFTSRVTDARKLENKIAAQLEKSLGYPVDTFVRTRTEVAAIAVSQPFGRAHLENPAPTIYVSLVHDALTPAQSRGLVACRSTVDEFHVTGREYYWLCRIRSNESKVWASPQLRALRLPPATARNLTTMRRLAALYPPASA